MQKINKIYQQYKIPPLLQLHMYRVAAVANLVCDNFTQKLDIQNIISACLLHDMGNIIKFNIDASLLPDSFLPEGKEYWKQVQQEFFIKYGHEEHHATYTMAKEIGISERTFDILTRVGFSKAEANYETDDYSVKIAAYADDRVGPHGILSLEERHADGIERYLKNKGINLRDQDYYQSAIAKHLLIEQQIMKLTKIKPEQITNDTIAPYLKLMPDFILI